jgi:hypothetical protein
MACLRQCRSDQLPYPAEMFPIAVPTVPDIVSVPVATGTSTIMPMPMTAAHNTTQSTVTAPLSSSNVRMIEALSLRTIFPRPLGLAQLLAPVVTCTGRLLFLSTSDRRPIPKGCTRNVAQFGACCGDPGVLRPAARRVAARCRQSAEMRNGRTGVVRPLDVFGLTRIADQLP